MSRALRKLCLVGAPVLALACTGEIGEGKNGATAPSNGGSTAPNQPSPNGNGNGSPAPGGPSTPAQPPGSLEPPSTISGAQTCKSGKPGPRLLRRLSAEQLDNSVRDLFRNPAAPKSDVFNDPQVLGFTGDASALLVRDLGSQQLMSYAEQVARWAVATVTDLSPCKEMTPACRTDFIKKFGQRAFRQPLKEATVARYEKLFAGAMTFEQGLELTITAMLQSPHFLYRTELGEPDAAKPGLVRLTPYEIASNISYLITRSTPDDQLLAAAAGNQLSSAAQIDAQVERLLADPKNRQTMHTFMSEWLESKRVAMVLKDPKVFDFPDALRADMERETAALIEDVVFTRKGSMTDLLTTNYTFVNAALAKHYGVTGVTSATDLVKTTTMRDPGILVQGSMMAGHGGTEFSSPTLRGKMVRTRLLCESLPPPPDDVDTMIKVPENAKTTRQIFETHSMNASCEGCHKVMDPIGYAFENYDLVGRYRTQENGVTIDPSGVIHGRDFRFANLRELNDYLANSKDVRQCMVRFLSYFAYGAANWADDGCTHDAITAEAEKANWSIRSVLTAITHAPHFTTRVQ